MRSYPTKYSLWVILGILGALTVIYFIDWRFVAMLLGSGARTLTDPRFIVIALLFSIAVFRLPPLLLGVMAGLAYKAFLHLTLQSHWRELGISSSFSNGLIKDVLAGVLFVSIVHLVAGTIWKRDSGDKP